MAQRELERANEMLRIAATYIRDFYPQGEAEYDGTTCDGYCIADDCESAAADIGVDDGFEKE